MLKVHNLVKETFWKGRLLYMNKAQRGVEKRQEKGNVRGLNKIASVLQLPAAVIAGVAHMEVSGNHGVVLEGCGGIIEYTDDVVRVKTGKSITKFNGKNLEIKCIQIDSLIIQGFITSIEFQF